MGLATSAPLLHDGQPHRERCAVRGALHRNAASGPLDNPVDKLLLRRRIVEEFAKHEDRAIEEWLDIWYSPETQALAKSKVVIRS